MVGSVGQPRYKTERRAAWVLWDPQRSFRRVRKTFVVMRSAKVMGCGMESMFAHAWLAQRGCNPLLHIGLALPYEFLGDFFGVFFRLPDQFAFGVFDFLPEGLLVAVGDG